jgi:hypothetical protein
MKLLIEVIALLVISAIIISIAMVVLGRNPVKLAQGELRCHGGGAIVITIDGKDYAVNGMASTGYPPIQDIWNKEGCFSRNRHRPPNRAWLDAL